MFSGIIAFLYLSLIITAYSLKEVIDIEELQYNSSSQREHKVSKNSVQGLCHQPFPKCFPIATALENTQSVFIPCCVILHRCETKECCRRNKVFPLLPLHAENITFTVLEENRVTKQKRYLRLTFQNHTQCC